MIVKFDQMLNFSFKEPFRTTILQGLHRCFWFLTNNSENQQLLRELVEPPGLTTTLQRTHFEGEKRLPCQNPSPKFS